MGVDIRRCLCSMFLFVCNRGHREVSRSGERDGEEKVKCM